MSTKTFEEIMREITFGLKGDASQDVPYLHEQMEKYKDHEYGKEIIRACGRLLYEVLPEDRRKKLDQLFENDQKGFEAALEEVRFTQYKKDYPRALNLINQMIDQYTETGAFEEDQVSIYKCFGELFEQVLYRFIFKPKKDVRPSQVDYATMYLQKGSILFDLGRYDEAAKALHEARNWNPVSAPNAFEYAETFKKRGKLEQFAEITREVFRYAYRPKELARCYRNMGYYYVEMEDYPAAVACFLISTAYEDSSIVQSELYYISGKADPKDMNISPKEGAAILKDRGVPVGPDSDVIGIAYQLGTQSFKEGDLPLAGYFLSIVDSFFDDKDVKKMLKKCIAN